MAAKVIDGKAIATQIRAEVADAVRALGARGVTPGLATVLVGDDPASHTYVRAKRRACAQAGIANRDHDLDAGISERELLGLIRDLNHDPLVHGMLVQLPLPDHLDQAAVTAAVDPAKDADGFHPHNLGLLLAGEPRMVPATPAGVRELLLRAGVTIEGAHVVILGRSQIVGRPLAALLSIKGDGGDATVTVCHTRTKDLGDHTRRADILVAAMGRARAVTGDMVAPGSVVVDVGINRTQDGIVGDVDYEGASARASAITPVPGGVGPMTIAMLLRNTVALAESSAPPG